MELPINYQTEDLSTSDLLKYESSLHNQFVIN